MLVKPLCNNRRCHCAATPLPRFCCGTHPWGSLSVASALGLKRRHGKCGYASKRVTTRRLYAAPRPRAGQRQEKRAKATHTSTASEESRQRSPRNEAREEVGGFAGARCDVREKHD